MQKINAQVICSFEKDSIEIKNGQSISNKFFIENSFNSPIKLVKEFKDSLAIITLPDTIVLNPKEKKIFLVKYLATPQLFQSVGNQIAVSYRKIDEMNSSIKTAFHFIFLNQQSLYLSPSSQIIYLGQQNNSTQAEIFCVNKGYANLNFNIDLNIYPKGLFVREKNLKFNLAPGEQKTFTLHLENTVAKNLGTDYNLMIQALDDNKKQLAFTQIKILLLTSDKRMALSNNLSASLVNNTVRLSNWQSSYGQNYLQLSNKGNVAINKNDKIGYNLNLNYYNKPINGFEMFDSRLEYQHKNVNIKLGNISENFDYSIYGKGVEVSDFIDKKNTVTALVAQNNYFLFSDVNNQMSGPTIVAGNYTFHETSKETQVSILHSVDPLTNVRANLISGSSKLHLSTKEYVEIDAGSSYEFLPGTTSVGKYGYAAGIDYRNIINRWSLSSNNYYSSPYYSGIRRGSMLFDERLGYKANNTFSFYLHYSKVDNAAKYLDSIFNYFGGYNNNTIYATELLLNLHQFKLNFRPYYFSQYLTQNNSTFIFPSINSFSKHGALDVGYYFKNNQFNLTVDFGMVTSNNTALANKNYNVLRILANYNSQFIGFNALAQNNPYYINEEPTFPQQGDFKEYSFGPTLHFNLFRGQMRFQASDYINYYGYTANWNNALQTQIDYTLHNSWILSAQAFYNFYPKAIPDKYLQTRISIEKQFLQSSAPGYKKLSLVFYGDENADDKFDVNEKPIQGVIAEVNNLMARSDKKGKINFSNLKQDYYKVHIQDGNGWDLSRPLEIQLVRNQTIYVPLIKSVQVKGNITIVDKNNLLKTATNLEGIRIFATDFNNKAVSSLTDANGDFYFMLSAKEYRFDIQLNDKNLSAIVPSQIVMVKQEGTPTLNFQIVDKSRKVDIQKF